MYVTVILVLGAFFGGFVTGLAGFGTALAALSFWLYVVDPVVAAALVVICSVAGQIQSLYILRRIVKWRYAWPFLIGGIIGVPVGVATLRFVDPKTLKVFLGLLLVGYSGLSLGLRKWPVIAWGGRIADGVAGFGGGALGGIAGLSGPLPIIWCGLRGWSANTQRGVYQPFNLIILGCVLAVYATQGILTKQVWGFGMFCLPATFLGAYLGIRMYGRVNEKQFRYIVLWMLLVSGLVLAVSNLL